MAVPWCPGLVVVDQHLELRGLLQLCGDELRNHAQQAPLGVRIQYKCKRIADLQASLDVDKLGPASCSWPNPMQQANGRIATLDGVRAISICFVLCAHSLGTGILPMLSVAPVSGNLGVRSCFVPSGFLITTLPLREGARDRPSLRAFYLGRTRRARRILPAFYVYPLVLWQAPERRAPWSARHDLDRSVVLAVHA